MQEMHDKRHALKGSWVDDRKWKGRDDWIREGGTF
jgi:hypothetical protein